MAVWLRVGAAVLCVGVAVEAAAQSSSPFSGLGRIFGGGDPLANAPVGFDLAVAGGSAGLADRLRNASLVAGALRDGRYTGQDLLAAARADYARLLGTLYDEGLYDAVIEITLDGREAAQIAPLDAPDAVSRVAIRVATGPAFRFSRAEVAPLAPGTELPRDFRRGEIAGTGIIKQAAREGIAGWRQYGHAKADAGATDIVADHATQLLDARIALSPGPLVTFGTMRVQGLERLREGRLREIAGFPTGDRFDPDTLDAVRSRLRRTGVFSAITLAEADTLGPDGSLDLDLTVVEQKPRRVGAGLEISNQDGAAVSGYWLHRNLFGGAERFRVEGKLSDIGSGTSGRDYELNLRLDRPATFGRDFTAYVAAGAARMREEDYDSDSAFARVGLDYYRNDNLSGGVGVEYRWQKVTDESGTTEFRTLALPLSGVWDKRDVDTDPKRGFWLNAELTPFRGLDETTGSGVRGVVEGRAYRSFGADERLTFAGRARVGTVIGPELAETPRDYLFYSGGGGTVRGQPYQSLGVEALTTPQGEPVKTGGMSIATVSAEARVQVREKIGVVGFVDAGRVWADGAFEGDSGWHAGAGLGLRYITPIGPIRVDVAAPVGGGADTGNGVQVYLGLGQAF